MYDQAHWKSRGTLFPQTFKSKLSEMGMLRLIPKMLALMAVQRQTAASRSRRPWMTLQHGVTGGEPMVTFSKEPSTSAHTPSLRASLGQEAEDGVGSGFGFGFGLGEGQDPQALIRVKKRMLTEKKRASDAELFEPISQILIASS
ncbi:hypothetical protein Dsin_004731 [Dipteronia sinensis]|uniref:Uncharacterized protein n=1 Tax=Dipteronia sinensis TaxID=43782 RepID=A0AAE0AWM1_9ROSI|nr:hypothetical protein Dsin_004731 [Dipteronia sinensis]